MTKKLSSDLLRIIRVYGSCEAVFSFCHVQYLFQDSAAAHDHHHHGPDFEHRGPDDGDVAATFVFEEESDESHSTTSLAPTTRSRRPTGMPYVLADQANKFT